MRLLDEQYTQTPFYGVKRMTAWLRRQGEVVNEKRVRRFLRTMGLIALYPEPKTSQSAPGHRIYPYLLRQVPITRPDLVWSTDITYIRLAPVQQAGDAFLPGSFRGGVRAENLSDLQHGSRGTIHQPRLVTVCVVSMQTVTTLLLRGNARQVVVELG